MLARVSEGGGRQGGRRPAQKAVCRDRPLAAHVYFAVRHSGNGELHCTSRNIPAARGLVGIVEFLGKVGGVVGVEHLTAFATAISRIIQHPDDAARVPIGGHRGRDGWHSECLRGLGCGRSGDEARAARVKGKSLQVVGGLSNLTRAAEIEIPVPVGRRTPLTRQRAGKFLHNLRVAGAAAAIVSHVVAINEVNRALLACRGQKMLVRRASRQIGQQEDAPGGEIQIVQIEIVLIVGREVVGQREGAAGRHAELDNALAKLVRAVERPVSSGETGVAVGVGSEPGPTHPDAAFGAIGGVVEGPLLGQGAGAVRYHPAMIRIVIAKRRPPHDDVAVIEEQARARVLRQGIELDRAAARAGAGAGDAGLNHHRSAELLRAG